jgi:voltage-dependent calcium channel L type alpha-1D
LEDIVATEASGSSGVLSAMRGIRLLRVFKLARSWKSFSDILASSYKTLLDVRMFLILLSLFVFIFMLLGLDLYAYSIRFDELGEPI